MTPSSCSASLLWCLCEPGGAPDVPRHQRSPWTPLPSVFPAPSRALAKPDVEPKKSPKIKTFFCFVKFLPSIGEHLQAVVCKVIRFTIQCREITCNHIYAWRVVVLNVTGHTQLNFYKDTVMQKNKDELFMKFVVCELDIVPLQNHNVFTKCNAVSLS